MVQAVKAAKREASSEEVVTVACNMPHGVILRGFRKEKTQEPVMGGGYRSVERSIETGERVEVFGNAVPFGQAPKTRIVAGYALTDNVPKNLWDLWLEQNADAPMVKNRLIFAWVKPEDAVAQAKEMRGTLNGLQPLDPKNDPRRPRSLNKNVSAPTQDVGA